MAARIAVVVGLFAALALGCEPSGATLTVRLHSGLRAGVEGRYADVRLQPGVTSCRRDATILGNVGRVLEPTDQRALGDGSLTIGEFRALEPGLYTLRARLQAPPRSASGAPDSGETIVERCVAVTLTNSRVVRIALTSDCVGVVCPAPSGNPDFDQCLNGRCVDPRCDPEDPATDEYCCDVEALAGECETSPTVCRDGMDCDRIMCAGPVRCDRGACIEADEDLCGPGFYCSAVAEACAPDPTFADAGMIDAGAPLDTGVGAVDGGRDAGPGMGLICDPCASASECDEGGVCAALDAGARACVPTCTLEVPDCPRGFSCADDGSGTIACLPLGGVCCIDEDGDGYGAGRGCLDPDCDDADAARNPGRVELCNGVDDDCDLSADDPPTNCAAGDCDAAGTSFTETGGEVCSAGACTPSGSATSCGAFTCSGGGDAGDRCARTCAGASGADEDRYCVASAHCDAGACLADVGDGSGCDEDSDCATSRCQAGVCCTPGVGGCACAGGPTESVCDDSGDSDCDGSVDCADSDCAGRPCGPRGRVCSGTSCACPGGGTETACSNGTDDDCDGMIDCGDGDCSGRSCGAAGRVCVGMACACPGGAVETSCGDGADQDCDGASDCADPDCGGRACGAGRVCSGASCVCAGPGSESTCSDGADQDCDGMIDCADPDCAGEICADGGRRCAGGACACAGGGFESRCDDSEDGDCDALFDCDDPDCTGRSCGPFGRVCAGGGSCTCPSGTTESSCSNGMDDDCDGQIDCQDPECTGQSCGTMGRTCASGACGCAGGGVETACGDGTDNDCDGQTDCMDGDCNARGCGGGMTCCPTCVSLPPMYSSYTTQALMCAGVTLGASSYAGICAVHVFYRSTCGVQDQSGWFPGWRHEPSNPPGCDYNGCDASGNCEENFCIPCPGDDCRSCPDTTDIVSC